MRSAGCIVSELEIDGMMHKYDPENVKQIDIEGYISSIEELSHKESCIDNIKNAFYLFDKSENGMILISEFKHVLTSLGDILSDEEMESILFALDNNSDSYIRMNDLLNLMHLPSPHSQ